jgi:hypothetical protein
VVSLCCGAHKTRVERCGRAVGRGYTRAVWAKSESRIGGIGRKAKAMPGECAFYSMRLPKIPQAEIIRQSSPQWFLPMFTSRIKRHSPPPTTANVPVLNTSFSCSLPSSRPTSCQLSPSGDVSTHPSFTRPAFPGKDGLRYRQFAIVRLFIPLMGPSVPSQWTLDNLRHRITSPISYAFVWHNQRVRFCFRHCDSCNDRVYLSPDSLILSI